MTANIHSDYFDAGLQLMINENENLYICSAEPTTYAEAATTYKLATKASPTLTGPGPGDVSGRKITIGAISDGVVNTNGNAKWWALCDDSQSKLQCRQELTTYKDITTSDPFTMAALDVEFPAPTA